jgi:hypothetical protein
MDGDALVVHGVSWRPGRAAVCAAAVILSNPFSSGD